MRITGVNDAHAKKPGGRQLVDLKRQRGRFRQSKRAPPSPHSLLFLIPSEL